MNKKIIISSLLAISTLLIGCGEDNKIDTTSLKNLNSSFEEIFKQVPENKRPTFIEYVSENNIEDFNGKTTEEILNEMEQHLTEATFDRFIRQNYNKYPEFRELYVSRFASDRKTDQTAKGLMSSFSKQVSDYLDENKLRYEMYDQIAFEFMPAGKGKIRVKLTNNSNFTITEVHFFNIGSRNCSEEFKIEEGLAPGKTATYETNFSYYNSTFDAEKDYFKLIYIQYLEKDGTPQKLGYSASANSTSVNRGYNFTKQFLEFYETHSELLDDNIIQLQDIETKYNDLINKKIKSLIVEAKEKNSSNANKEAK